MQSITWQWLSGSSTDIIAGYQTNQGITTFKPFENRLSYIKNDGLQVKSCFLQDSGTFIILVNFYANLENLITAAAFLNNVIPLGKLQFFELLCTFFNLLILHIMKSYFYLLIAY